MQEKMVGRSRSNERSSSLLYERLHTEELRKGRRTSEKKLVKSATTKTAITTKVETVVQHLYTDHFTREQKL